MGEESNTSDFDRFAHDAGAATEGSDGVVDGDDGRIIDWESDLPSAEDLVPLSQILVSPALVSAFSIPPLNLKTMLDVNRAAHNTIYNLCHCQNTSSSSPSAPAPLKTFSSTATATDDDDPMQIEADYPEPCDLPKTLPAEIENGSCSLRAENTADDNSARTLKRPRLVWTPHLHKRFVEVVAHLGVKNAVPKTIMQLMNVEGLTRENVASHLQKYRIYLKRMQGLSNEEPSSSDNVFTPDPPAPQSLLEHKMQQPVPVPVPMPVPMPYAVPTMIPMPVSGMPYHHAHGVVPVNNYQGGLCYTSFNSTHPHLSNHWSSGSKFDSVLSYPHVSPNDK